LAPICQRSSGCSNRQLVYSASTSDRSRARQSDRLSRCRQHQRMTDNGAWEMRTRRTGTSRCIESALPRWAATRLRRAPSSASVTGYLPAGTSTCSSSRRHSGSASDDALPRR
jgi:hypothetical protein